ncbi:hypothetical protein BJ170DRAFT_221422 [Xylariales sp. AK1849]|nr:hypothetical protein BJ170DRAFT_221422 [Xylariales sp. AK1849]
MMRERVRSETIPEPRRIRRPAVSCSLCRRRKIRCNRENPCSNCLRSKNHDCVYENQFDTQRHLQRLSPRPSSDGTTQDISSHSHGSHVPGSCSKSRDQSTPGSQRSMPQDPSYSSTSWTNRNSTKAASPGSQQSGLTVDALNSRIKNLEQRLSHSFPPHIADHPASVANPETANTIRSQLVADIHTTDRGVMSKTRLFGRTHWMNGVALLKPMLEGFERMARDRAFESLVLLKRCKSLGKIIKTHRSSSSMAQAGADVPRREIANRLIDGYLRTFEKTFRVLHIPSFEAECEKFWLAPETSAPTFILQLKLVMAIGAATYDERFSFRVSAVQWINEANTWVSNPSSKTRLNVPSLQIMILLCLAREATAVGGELIWISAGTLLRVAMYMGLHRDPRHLPRMTSFASEMRRRLWNTILEIALQSSVDSGGPPLISLGDFDTEPPGNYDDVQLTPTEDSIYVAKPLNCYTQTSLVIVLRDTFPIRLTIARFLNELGSQGTYAETLRLDANLRAAYKRLSRTLQTFSGVGPAISQFELRIADFIVRRYFLALHLPFLSRAMHDAAQQYAFSRRVVVETSLRIWRVVSPGLSTAITGSHDEPAIPDDMARLAICAGGVFRTVPVQATFSIAVELRAHLLEEEGLGPLSLRPDLLAVIHEARERNLQRVHAGETNVKGYLCMCVICTQLEAVARGLPDNEIHQLFVEAAEEAVRKCLAILEGMAAQCQSVEADEDIIDLGADLAPEVDDGWDIYGNMSHVQFNFGEAGPFFGSDWLNETPPDLTNW